jgi:hypothetical protein
MVSDSAAAQRMVDRLLAVRWDDDDAAYAHQRSRGQLTIEFLRRTAVWAQAVGAETGWPFSDLAGALDPEVSVDPSLMARLASDPSAGDFLRLKIHTIIVRWAALGELALRQFPHLDDPYEPLLVLFDRGGGCMPLKGFIELGYGAVPIRSLAARALLAPRPIDEATLNARDARDAEN